MASDTGGVKSFSIQGRLYRERERLHGSGMTEKERAWRKKWIQDQRLSPNEPRHVPELYKEIYNPIRRLYWMPLDKLFKALEPVIAGVEPLEMRRDKADFKTWEHMERTGSSFWRTYNLAQGRLVLTLRHAPLDKASELARKFGTDLRELSAENSTFEIFKNLE